MSDSAEFPDLSFSCPQLWAGMKGNEKTRFCDVCQKNVHNLSMMTAGERRALLASTGESPCVAYFRHVNGTPIDVTALAEGNPLKHILTQAAVVSLSAVTLMTACSKSETQLKVVPKAEDTHGYTMVPGMICPPFPPSKPRALPPPTSIDPNGPPGGLPPFPLGQ